MEPMLATASSNRRAWGFLAGARWFSVKIGTPFSSLTTGGRINLVTHYAVFNWNPTSWGLFLTCSPLPSLGITSGVNKSSLKEDGHQGFPCVLPKENSRLQATTGDYPPDLRQEASSNKAALPILWSFSIASSSSYRFVAAQQSNGCSVQSQHRLPI